MGEGNDISVGMIKIEKKERKVRRAVSGIRKIVNDVGERSRGVREEGGEEGNDIKKEIRELCERAGIKLEEIYRVLKEGLNARKKIENRYGEEYYVDDHTIRHKYLMTALELLGHIRVDKGIGINIGKEGIDEETATAILLEVRQAAKRVGVIEV